MPTIQDSIQAIIDKMSTRGWLSSRADDGTNKAEACQSALDAAVDVVAERRLTWPAKVQGALYLLCHTTLDGSFALSRPGFQLWRSEVPTSQRALTDLDMALRAKVKAAIDTVVDNFIAKVRADRAGHLEEDRPELTSEDIKDIFGLPEGDYASVDAAIQAAKDMLKRKVTDICSATTLTACQTQISGLLTSISTESRNAFASGAAAGAGTDARNWQEQFVGELNKAFSDAVIRPTADVSDGAAAAGGPGH